MENYVHIVQKNNRLYDIYYNEQKAGEIKTIFNINKKDIVEIVYEIKEDWRGKGIGKQAIKLMSHILLDKKDINRIEAYVENTNIASIKVLINANFILDETWKASLYHSRYCINKEL